MSKNNEAKVLSSSSTLSAEDLKILKSPFPKNSLGVKVQSLNKERTRAMLVLYLQHTDVQDRLEQVDPAWTTHVTGEERIGDTVYVRTALTIKGVTRENVGEGGDPKAAFSDSLKRAAMLFGVGRYLYEQPTAWADYNEQKDRFRQWSVDDFERFIRGGGSVPEPEAEVSEPEPKAARPAAKASRAAATPRSEAATSKPGLKTQAAAPRSREQLNRILMNMYRPYLTKFPETRFVDLLQSRYKVGETRLMTVEQIEDLVVYMEAQMRAAA